MTGMNQVFSLLSQKKNYMYSPYWSKHWEHLPNWQSRCLEFRLQVGILHVLLTGACIRLGLIDSAASPYLKRKYRFIATGSLSRLKKNHSNKSTGKLKMNNEKGLFYAIKFTSQIHSQCCESLSETFADF